MVDHSPNILASEEKATVTKPADENNRKFSTFKAIFRFMSPTKVSET